MGTEAVDPSVRLRAFFGTELLPVGLEDWLEYVGKQIAAGRHRCLLGHHNLHSLYLRHHDHVMERFYARCENAYIDGVPVRWILSAAGVPADTTHRFSFMDVFPQLLRHCEQRGWSVFYLGSTETVARAARHRFGSEFPGLRLEIHNGYIEDNADVIRQINAFRPDLLLVGMGAPRQESWILSYIDQLDAGVVTISGATLDYFVGAQASPPGWMSRCGLGWLYRMAHDPTRLWRRYLIEPWSLLVPVLRLVIACRR